MKKIALNFPQLGFIVATRAALALGIGLLISRRLPKRRRRLVGSVLTGTGALATIPAAVMLSRGGRTRGWRR